MQMTILLLLLLQLLLLLSQRLLLIVPTAKLRTQLPEQAGAELFQHSASVEMPRDRPSQRLQNLSHNRCEAEIGPV